VPDTQKALFTMLKDGMSQLETALQAAEASLDTDTRKFAADVESRVAKLKKDVLALRERLDVPLLGSVESDMAEVMRYVEKQTASMKYIKEEADRLRHYQKMLRQPEAEFDTIDETQGDLTLKTKLWTSLKVRRACCCAVP
jgi:predicted outer membrane protein